MKKKIFGIALIAIMALAASWNFTQSKNEVNLSELALANVEALAGGEISPTNCPGGRHLCAWIHDPLGSTTYYDQNGPDDI